METHLAIGKDGYANQISEIGKDVELITGRNVDLNGTWHSRCHYG